LIISAKINPFLRRKENEEYFTNLIVDEDVIKLEDGTSRISMLTNEFLTIDFEIKTKDLYQLALLIINTVEDETNI
jgi:hypothetical protein